MNRMASVYLYDDGQEVDVPCRYVEPTPPSKYDKVYHEVYIVKQDASIVQGIQVTVCYYWVCRSSTVDGMKGLVYLNSYEDRANTSREPSLSGYTSNLDMFSRQDLCLLWNLFFGCSCE